VDVEAAEGVQLQLDGFIEKRARESADANRTEELWAASEARDRERRRRRDNREAWLEYERHMERLHASLSEEHRAKAEALNEGGLC
jgi:hypothetical protein